MRIQDERLYLPVFRGCVAKQNDDDGRLLESIGELFEKFLASGKDEDKYLGWCFNIVFNKEIKEMPSGGDDFCLTIHGKGQILIHLHSFLWQ